jgi:hypothetical protein
MPPPPHAAAASCEVISVAEPHHSYADPAPGKNFDAAPAHSLLYTKQTFFRQTMVKTKRLLAIVSSDFYDLKCFKSRYEKYDTATVCYIFDNPPTVCSTSSLEPGPSEPEPYRVAAPAPLK